MILIIELASIVLALALIVIAAVLPDVIARLRRSDDWTWENNWLP